MINYYKHIINISIKLLNQEYYVYKNVSLGLTALGIIW